MTYQGHVSEPDPYVSEGQYAAGSVSETVWLRVPFPDGGARYWALDRLRARLPEHLREAARRSWEQREADYRYLAEH